jgi:hypothetical protein
LCYAYRCNGLSSEAWGIICCESDRVSQTVGITTTNYTLDTSTSLSAGLAAGLTQLLFDGTDTYLYGNGRIAQHDASGAQYFLGDALGSVRQLVDANGEVLLLMSQELGVTVTLVARDASVAQYARRVVRLIDGKSVH